MYVSVSSRPIRVFPLTNEGVGIPKGSDDHDHDDHEPKGGRPGPADHGHEGGMATRENAPESTEPDDES
jgi:hypothetical protein